MSVTVDEDLLVGVDLVGEISNGDSCDTLGAVVLKDVVNVAGLRKLLCQQLPAVPPDFLFLTKQGWPVIKDQEAGISIAQILCDNSVIHIRRHFDKPRVGIRLWRNEVIGFAFVDMGWTVTELREALQKQMAGKSNELKSNFNFLDKNGWPVNSFQEVYLTVWDLISGNYITLRPEAGGTFVHPGQEVIKKKKKFNLSTHENRSLQKQKSVSSDNGALVLTSIEEDTIPSVLISYVRAEAEKHARDLKWKLSDIGFRVFLDIDEIRGGLDWQDELNDAVQTCGVFVPLITSQYGLTLWSNREVKLADQMNKCIIPVNFLDSWPPQCLAIQFSSLQYVPWKTQTEIQTAIDDGEVERAKDVRFWDTMYVQRVAEEISNCYNKTRDVPANLKPPVSAAALTLNSHMSTDNAGKTLYLSKPKKKPVVVISVHPKQRSLAQQIYKYLMASGNDVWCSTDLLDLMEISEDPQSNASSPLTPLPQNESLGNSDGSCDSYNIFSTCKRQHSFDGMGSYSDLSRFSLSPDVPNKLHIFREQVKKADVIIVLVSKAYCKSKTCQKQVYYCEHRKMVIIVQVEAFQLPCWLTVLLGNDALQYKDSQEFLEELKRRIDNSCDPSTTCSVSFKELQLLPQISKLEKHIDKRTCIYICGSTKFCYPKSENICHALGQELAGLSRITLATGGFYGVGEAVGRSFCEEREIKGEKPANLYHILPERDVKDFSQEARQNQDGTFQKIPYGQTIFIGNSVRERETLVARVFNICILIEGGQKDARLVEEFVWNDNIVIPIMSTGGAASGEHGAPGHILELPAGASEHDWVILAKRDVTADDVAHAVKRIVCSLLWKKNNISQPKKKSKKY